MDDTIIAAAFQAVRNDDAEEMIRLLRAYPALKDRQTGVGTWLHKAATVKAFATLKALVAFGFDVNTPDHPGGTPPEAAVFNAVMGGSAEIVQWLLEQGAQSNCVAPAEGGVLRNFALGTAVSDNRLDLVKLLVEHGADPNIYYGERNALLVAQRMGYTDMVEYLRSKGAKLPHELGLAPPDEPLEPKKGAKKK
jgi:ankyrin repeat protein